MLTFLLTPPPELSLIFRFIEEARLIRPCGLRDLAASDFSVPLRNGVTLVSPVPTMGVVALGLSRTGVTLVRDLSF